MAENKEPDPVPQGPEGREEGYYWVRLHIRDEWEVGHWFAGAWWLTAVENVWIDEHFAEIGERITRS